MITSVSNLRRKLKWTALATTIVLACGGISIKTWFDRPPAVTLPDGTVITYNSSSRGIKQGGTGLFQHAPPPGTESKLIDSWHWLRSKLRNPWQPRLPVGTIPTSTFPNWPDIHEFELRLQFTGSLRQHQWVICVADEKGWETEVVDYIAADPAQGSSNPGWIRLGSAYPRHSKKIFLRFYPNERLKPGPNADKQQSMPAELVLNNPFYEGPALAPGPKPPITKFFRYGEVTLEQITRGLQGLNLDVSLRQNQKPLDGFEIDLEEVSDRSGQWFRQTYGSSEWVQPGRRYIWNSTAPWSDDLCWTIRLHVRRGDYFRDVSENEKFVFDHLPVPQGAGVEVNRSITNNGVILRISRIELSKYGDWRFCVEGWSNPTNGSQYTILIQDARDDQGRTHARGTRPIVGGPVGGSSLGPVYCVDLPPDAKWWNLTLVPETIETVEFQVQPDFKR